jgi:predicted membrane GTPase involved in stress response
MHGQAAGPRKVLRGSGEEVYVGQVIGESPKPGEELVVNVVRTKKLTNMRASGTDEKLKHRAGCEVQLGGVHGVHRMTSTWR